MRQSPAQVPACSALGDARITDELRGHAVFSAATLCPELGARCPLPENPSRDGHTCLRPSLLGDHVPNLTDDSIRAAVTLVVGGRLSQETLRRGGVTGLAWLCRQRKGRG